LVTRRASFSLRNLPSRALSPFRNDISVTAFRNRTAY